MLAAAGHLSANFEIRGAGSGHRKASAIEMSAYFTDAGITLACRAEASARTMRRARKSLMYYNLLYYDIIRNNNTIQHIEYNIVQYDISENNIQFQTE